MFKNPSSGIKPKIVQDSSGNPKAFEIPNLGFERIVGRNILQKHQNKTAFLQNLKPWILPDGFFVIVETVPALGQRLSELIPEGKIEQEIINYLKSAEEEIYKDPENARCNWTPKTLRDEMESADWNIIRWEVKEFFTPTLIRTTQIEKWFAVQPENSQSNYWKLLSAHFSADQLNNLLDIFLSEVAGNTVNWRSVCLFMKFCKKRTNGS